MNIPVCPSPEPPTPSLATQHHRGRVCDCLQGCGVGAGWMEGLAGTNRHNRTFQKGTNSYQWGGREGLAAMATGPGSQACRGFSGGVL